MLLFAVLLALNWGGPSPRPCSSPGPATRRLGSNQFGVIGFFSFSHDRVLIRVHLFLLGLLGLIMEVSFAVIKPRVFVLNIFTILTARPVRRWLHVFNPCSSENARHGRAPRQVGDLVF